MGMRDRIETVGRLGNVGDVTGWDEIQIRKKEFYILGGTGRW